MFVKPVECFANTPLLKQSVSQMFILKKWSVGMFWRNFSEKQQKINFKYMCINLKVPIPSQRA